MRMRQEGIPLWYSIDTGPSVFINTFKAHVERVTKRLHKLKISNFIVSEIGGKPSLTDKHLGMVNCSLLILAELTMGENGVSFSSIAV